MGLEQSITLSFFSVNNYFHNNFFYIMSLIYVHIIACHWVTSVNATDAQGHKGSRLVPNTSVDCSTETGIKQ